MIRCFTVWRSAASGDRSRSGNFGARTFVRPQRLLAMFAVALLFIGCATPKIDWASRVGNYTMDQAILELGPPDKQAELQDKTVVADWLMRRGHSYHYPLYGYYGYPYYGPVYPAYGESYTPDSFLRLTFGPDGALRAWKKFYR